MLGLLIMKHVILPSEGFWPFSAQADVSVTGAHFWNFCENKGRYAAISTVSRKKEAIIL